MGGLPTQKTVYAFAYNPKDPQIMYAAVRDGLYHSSNAGKRWSRLGKSPKGIVTIAVHPEKPSGIFVGTDDGKILLSRDGGDTWRVQNK